MCSDGNRFKEHVNSKQHKRAAAKEQELMGMPVTDEGAHLLQVCPSLQCTQELPFGVVGIKLAVCRLHWAASMKSSGSHWQA